jgi:starch synthase
MTGSVHTEMKVLFASNEVAPYAKVGGLADVAGTLPPALAEQGVDIRVVMPLHRQCLAQGRCELVLPKLPVLMGGQTLNASVLQSALEDGRVPVYFVNYGPYFDRPEVYGEGGTDYPDAAERYAFFARAVLALPGALAFDADVIHANDWPTGLMPLFAGEQSSPPATVYTIHNLGYQGQFPSGKAAAIGIDPGAESRQAAMHAGKLNYMAAGIRAATLVTTVSERYAQEIQTEQYGQGLQELLRARSEDLYGVLNGIDYDYWHPATDAAITANFGPDDPAPKAQCKAALQAEMGLPARPDVPLVGCVSRMAWQKGLDMLAEVIPEALKLPMQFAILGTGEHELEQEYEELDKAYPHAVAAALRYDDALARRIYAGCDMFAMPSRYEPCGLGQMIAMAYGTVPVVHSTGGLADTVLEWGDQQTGFVFTDLSVKELLSAFQRAATVYRDPAAWRNITLRAMAQDFSWSVSARRYHELYQQAAAKAAAESRPSRAGGRRGRQDPPQATTPPPESGEG